jgi:hypothetical protein
LGSLIGGGFCQSRPHGRFFVRGATPHSICLASC